MLGPGRGLWKIFSYLQDWIQPSLYLTFNTYMTSSYPTTDTFYSPIFRRVNSRYVFVTLSPWQETALLYL